MGSNKKKGETYLNYVVPKQYGDANGFQAGSTFKAFVLSAAISQGIPLSTQIIVTADGLDPGEPLPRLPRHYLPGHGRVEPGELHRQPAPSTSTRAPSCR